MHELVTILKALFLGLATGFIVSIPLGPAGIESVKRTVAKGYKQGFIVSLGAIGADLTYLMLINAGLSNILAANKKTEALFWIVAGIVLSLIGYISIRGHKHNTNKSKLFRLNNLNSMPFLAGFMITFSNPMTPSLWLTMSGTVIRAWYYVSKLAYYLFILSIILGMIAWFALLNYLALKGTKILKPTHFNKTSKLLNIAILTIGIGFIIFGVINLIC